MVIAAPDVPSTFAPRMRVRRSSSSARRGLGKPEAVLSREGAMLFTRCIIPAALSLSLSVSACGAGGGSGMPVTSGIPAPTVTPTQTPGTGTSSDTSSIEPLQNAEVLGDDLDVNPDGTTSSSVRSTRDVGPYCVLVTPSKPLDLINVRQNGGFGVLRWRGAATNTWYAHTGVDLLAPVGSKVYAADAGVVAEVGNHTGYGLTVVIDHSAQPSGAKGYETLYAHLSATNVHIGDTVSAGALIALSGATGNATGESPHLHFEVSNGGPLFGPGRIIIHDYVTSPCGLLSGSARILYDSNVISPTSASIDQGAPYSAAVAASSGSFQLPQSRIGYHSLAFSAPGVCSKASASPVILNGSAVYYKGSGPTPPQTRSVSTGGSFSDTIVAFADPGKWVVTNPALQSVLACAPPSIVGTYTLTMYRGIGVPGLCGASLGCGNGLMITGGTAKLNASTWAFSIAADLGPTEGVRDIYSNVGGYYYSGRAPQPYLYPAQPWCSAAGNVPNQGFCSQLPAGPSFGFFSYEQPSQGCTVASDDGSTLYSCIGGSTVWIRTSTTTPTI